MITRRLTVTTTVTLLIPEEVATTAAKEITDATLAKADQISINGWGAAITASSFTVQPDDRYEP